MDRFDKIPYEDLSPESSVVTSSYSLPAERLAEHICCFFGFNSQPVDKYRQGFVWQGLQRRVPRPHRSDQGGPREWRIRRSVAVSSRRQVRAHNFVQSTNTFNANARYSRKRVTPTSSNTSVSHSLQRRLRPTAPLRRLGRESSSSPNSFPTAIYAPTSIRPRFPSPGDYDSLSPSISPERCIISINDNAFIAISRGRISSSPRIIVSRSVASSPPSSSRIDDLLDVDDRFRFRQNRRSERD